MLARSFPSATDLGISETERDALIKVLHMLERDELTPCQNEVPPEAARIFDMGSWEIHLPGCGTAACIAGWAHIISSRKAFGFVSGPDRAEDSVPCSLYDLFVPFPSHRLEITQEQANMKMRTIQPAQAAHALSNYLTTGQPRWAEALA